MARLVVDGVSLETISGDIPASVAIAVSVSRGDTGEAVVGLTKENFGIASTLGSVKDFEVGSALELKMEPGDVQSSGCYILRVRTTPKEKFIKGERYVFGIQVKRYGPWINQTRFAVDQGQTVVELTSLGV